MGGLGFLPVTMNASVQTPHNAPTTSRSTDQVESTLDLFTLLTSFFAHGTITETLFRLKLWLLGLFKGLRQEMS